MLLILGSFVACASFTTVHLPDASKAKPLELILQRTHAGPLEEQRFMLILKNPRDASVRIWPEGLLPILAVRLTDASGRLIPKLPPPYPWEVRLRNVEIIPAKGELKREFGLRSIICEDGMKTLKGAKLFARFECALTQEQAAKLRVEQRNLTSNVLNLTDR